jgi:ABC-type uncharacterized transport system substrate-binding protein
LPTMHGVREYVGAGGLVSYGANYPDLLWRAADFVDKILLGANPGGRAADQIRSCRRGHRMTRRDLIALLGSTAVLWPRLGWT